MFLSFLIELIHDGTACHILCLTVMSSARCTANPERTAGTARPGQCLAGPSTARQHLQGMAMLSWCGLHVQLPAGLYFQCFSECSSTARIFLACCLHEFTLKACFLKTFSFICLKCAVSTGCTCSQGYYPRVNMEKAQSQHHQCRFPKKCRQVYLYM